VGVGAAVKEAVVMTLLAVFIVNYVISSLYALLMPQGVI
jgi:ABC-type transporter Mla maintaining outer membrane lipid asymmetry permease subunit MlaE